MVDEDFTTEEIVRIYATDIRKRLLRNGITLKHYISSGDQHYWLVSKDNFVAHGLTPSEALDKLEAKLI